MALKEALASKAYGAIPELSAEDKASGKCVVTHGGDRRAIFLSCLLAALIVSEGYDLGVMNGAVVLIKEDLGLTTVETSLLVTTSSVSAIFGAMFGGHLADSLGRIRALMASCLLLFLGPLGMALSKSLVCLVLFRAGVGMGIGSAIVVAGLYLAEVSPPKLRGRLVAAQEVGLTLGVMLGYAGNTMLFGVSNSWRWMIGLGCVLPMLVGALLALPQVPESPRWLFQAGREEEAEATLRLFIDDEDARICLSRMHEQKLEYLKGRSLGDGFSDWHQVAKEVKTDAKVRRMFVAGTLVMVTQIACGFTVLMYYSSIALKSVMSTQDAFRLTLLMGVSKVIFVGIAMAMLERVSRRSILLVSCAMVTVANAFLYLAFTLEPSKWALATGLVAFAAGHGIGLGPVTFVYLAEVFGTAWRGKGMACALGTSRFGAVFITFGFPLIFEAAGASVTFAGQTLLSAVLSIAMFAIVHETGSQSLESLAERCVT
mmetsp:Transcript_115720/g.334239  ORF Transcript_115720/g.334239 Transcript_115720/m.334239 type:complete len:486 (-) Transcript_115720:162-1619(-)